MEPIYYCQILQTQRRTNWNSSELVCRNENDYRPRVSTKTLSRILVEVQKLHELIRMIFWTPFLLSEIWWNLTFPPSPWYYLRFLDITEFLREKNMLCFTLRLHSDQVTYSECSFLTIISCVLSEKNCVWFAEIFPFT